MTVDGRAVLALGEAEVPHGQEVRVADFRDDLPGMEMAIRHRGHTPELIVVSSTDGGIVRRMTLNTSPTNVGMTAVRWLDSGRRALLYNGGWLWDLQQGTGAALPQLPPPGGSKAHRMGFYHAIAVHPVVVTLLEGAPQASYPDLLALPLHDYPKMSLPGPRVGGLGVVEDDGVVGGAHLLQVVQVALVVRYHQHGPLGRRCASLGEELGLGQLPRVPGLDGVQAPG